MRRFLLAAFALAALAGPAVAADPANPPDDHSVSLSPVAVPVVANGTVVNYVFVTVKVMLSPRADEFALRDKEPFFRDALVRAAYRTPFLVPNDYNKIDEGKLKAALFQAAVAIAGQGAIRGVAVMSETPQHFVRAPNEPPH
ncbi:MAG TPA: hypothetical protein VKU90_09445 [Caulobacteraceae bacterium]|nr:hypothetical protein [Caulobacteraceae bacterium]